VIALWVAIAGGLGAGARFVVDGAVRRRWATAFPIGTLLINVSGSLLLGLMVGLVLVHGQSDNLRLIIGTGFCGGFTTFSTASVETVRLAQDRLIGQALLYALGTLVLAMLAGAAGLALAFL
jgi:CrcB protein